MKRQFLLFCFMVLIALCSNNLQAKNKGNIAWLGTSPIKSDTGYVKLLKAAGYNVIDRTTTSGVLTADQLADLNRFDLIFLSRESSSGNYSDTTYNKITAPIVNLGCLVARTSRWDMFAASNDEIQKTDVLAAINKSHPIFTGVTFSDTSTVDIAAPGQAFRALVGAKSAGNGTMIAVTAKDSLALIAEWQPGTPYHSTSKKGTTPMGKRMVFFAPFGYALNAEGDKIVLNIAEYMITGTVLNPTKTIAWLGTSPIKSDTGYVKLLTAAGYKVVDKTTTSGVLTSVQLADLNSYDLIFLSRESSSGNYSDTTYNKITAPIVNLGCLVARTSRWDMFAATNDEIQKTDVLAAIDKSHPIFTGVTFSDTSTVDIAAPGQAFRALVGAKSAGNGTMIGVTAKDSLALITEWQPGTPYHSTAKKGTTPMGKRMVFFAPYGYALNAEGDKIVLNIAEYMTTGTVVDKSIKGQIAWMGNDIKSDSTYLKVLKSSGYNVVDKTATKGDLTTEQISDLNNYDLIVMSRASNSGDYQYPAKYNSIKTPILNLSCLVSRSNPVRWNMLPTDAGSEASKTDVLAVLKTDNPIFKGVKLLENNTIDVVNPGQQFRAISNGKSAGNGTLIGVTAKDSLMLMAEWKANTAYFTGSADVPKGNRMIFFAPFGSQLNDAGNIIFTNIAEYMITGAVADKPITITNVSFITENAKDDSLYIDLLTKNDCNVNVITNLNNVAPSDSALLVLDASDVIVFSRNTTSGGYQYLNQYNNLGTPIMLMSAYMARSSRWQVLETGTANDNVADTVTVALPEHEIFKGITLNSMNQLALIDSFKIGTCAINTAGNGTVLATSKSGTVVIAEWQKDMKFYEKSASVPRGERMTFFLTNKYNLTPDAEKVYVNAVKYLATFDYTFVNNAPTNLALSNDSIDEGLPVGTVVGTLSATDVDPATTLTYSLAAGDGINDQDNSLFTISGESLKTKAVMDFETKVAYNINVQVSDGLLTTSKSFVVSVVNVIETSIKSLSESGIQVYPNPYSDVLYVSSKVAGNATISIYNVTGQLMYQKLHTLNNTFELTLNIPKGMYIMEIDGDNVHYNSKLIRK
jgi:hypothetical protein